MEKVFEGEVCPTCKKGKLTGTVKKARVVLLHCSNSNCGAVYRMKRTKLTNEEMAKEEAMMDIPVLPPSTFMGLAKRLILYCIAFGTENLNARSYINNKSNLPVLQLVWFDRDFATPEEAEELMKQQVPPKRIITFLALDPAWIQYGIAPPPYTALASDEEVAIVQKIEDMEV